MTGSNGGNANGGSGGNGGKSGAGRVGVTSGVIMASVLVVLGTLLA